MDIIYYRKIAQIMMRELHNGNIESPVLSDAAFAVATTKNPKKRHKKIVKAWMYVWITEHQLTPEE